MRTSLVFIAFLSLAACNGGGGSDKQTALEASCIGTGMGEATCACLETAAKDTLDDRMYQTLTDAAAEAEAARANEGSEDGIMDRLPEDISENDLAQIGRFLQTLRSECRGVPDSQ